VHLSAQRENGHLGCIIERQWGVARLIVARLGQVSWALLKEGRDCDFEG